MGASVNEILDMIKKTVGDVQDLKRTVDDMSKRRSTSDERVVKAMMGARGGAWVPGNRGGDGADICDVIDPRRAKSLGREFGQWLTDVAHLSDRARWSERSPDAILKSLLSRPGCQPVAKTALAEGSGATGGYTVPTQFLSELIRLAAEESFLRPLCRSIPMTSRNILVPTLDQTVSPPAGGSSYYGGLAWSWQPESSNYQTNAETEPKFRQIELVARDLVGIVIASNQLLQDNAIALDTVLTTLFKEALGWAYDYFILQGNGAAQPLGMIKSPALISVNRSVSAHFNMTDAAGMLSHMVPSSYKSCIWIIHPSVLPDLITMTQGATNAPFLVWLNPVYQGNDGGPLANAIPGTILGRPMYITEKLPASGAGALGSVLLVDPGKYLVGDRMAIQIEASPYPNFSKNQMTWRIIARWDGTPEIVAPITLADGVFQVSSVVALQQ